MKDLIQMSLIFSSLIFGFALLVIVFMLGGQAVVSLFVAAPDEYFQVIVLVSGGFAAVTFAIFRKKIWFGIKEIWSQVLRNL